MHLVFGVAGGILLAFALMAWAPTIGLLFYILLMIVPIVLVFVVLFSMPPGWALFTVFVFSAVVVLEGRERSKPKPLTPVEKCLLRTPPLSREPYPPHWRKYD
jgi:hypothetical protein